MSTSSIQPSPSITLSRPQDIRRLMDSMTFRNWLKSFLTTLGIIGVCTTVYWVDKYGFDFQNVRDSGHRLFKNPTTTPMRIFGIPHFLIAVLFLMSSRRMKETRNKILFAALAVVGVGFCFLFKKVGANLSPFAVFIFYFYFLIHGFRDDAYFYQTYGDLPKDATAAHRRIVLVLQLLLIGLLFSLFWPTYAHMSASALYKRSDPILSNFFPSNWPFVFKLGSMFLPMVAIAAIALHRIARTMSEGWGSLWHSHQPILMVYLLSLGVLILAMLGGPAAFDIWILNHFVVWFIFALYLLRKYPPREPPPNIWSWMRTTPKGFATLHFGLAAVVTVLMAVSVYTYGQKAGPLDWVVGKESFYYWTIMHVTLSFVPR